MELKITDDKVKEAAKSCPDAARVLKTLFPEAFAPRFEVLNVDPNFESRVHYVLDGRRSFCTIAMRSGGQYAGKGIFLGPPPPGLEWAIVVDDEKSRVLILQEKPATKVGGPGPLLKEG